MCLATSLPAAPGLRGVIVFGGANGLVRIPETGGTPTPVTTLDAGAKEARHVGPWFLPDGRHLLFLALATGRQRGVVWAASIDDPARTRITESAGSIAYARGLAVVDDGDAASSGGAALRCQTPLAPGLPPTGRRSTVWAEHEQVPRICGVVERRARRRSTVVVHESPRVGGPHRTR